MGSVGRGMQVDLTTREAMILLVATSSNRERPAVTLGYSSSW